MRRGIMFLCLAVWLLYFVSSFPVCADVCAAKVYMTINTEQEFYSTAASMSANFIRKANVKVPFRINIVNGVRVSSEGIQKDAYAGGNLRAFFCDLAYESGGYYYYDLRFEYYITALQQKKVDRRAKQIAAQLYGLSDYEKVKAVHDYLILNCKYEFFKDGPYNALYHGTANCNGYSLAFQRIMDELNIPCKYNTGGSHAWNTVFVDGKWYNIDVTWDDDGGNTVSYLYFLQCNRLWDEHPYGSSDAENNHPLTGTLNRYSFPPYNLYYYGLRIILLAAVSVTVVLVVRRMRYGKTVYLVYNH